MSARCRVWEQKRILSGGVDHDHADLRCHSRSNRATNAANATPQALETSLTDAVVQSSVCDVDIRDNKYFQC